METEVYASWPGSEREGYLFIEYKVVGSYYYITWQKIC